MGEARGEGLLLCTCQKMPFTSVDGAVSAADVVDARDSL